MGMQIFEQSGTFDPKIHGLKIGDVLQIVCVGGGDGGLNSEVANGGAAGSGGSARNFLQPRRRRRRWWWWLRSWRRRWRREYERLRSQRWECGGNKVRYTRPYGVEPY